MYAAAVALLILSLTTGCSRVQQAHNSRSRPVASTGSTSTVHANPQAANTAPTDEPARPRPSAAAVVRAAGPDVPPTAPDQATTAATAAVETLISGQDVTNLADAELWAGVVTDSHVIQTTTLSASSDRATIAVSVAFDDRFSTEPIGLRIELLRIASGWTVLGIGYL